MFFAPHASPNAIKPSSGVISIVQKRGSVLPKGRYTVTLRDEEGKRYQVSIYAPDEKWIPYEFPGGGSGSHHEGNYRVALRLRGARQYIVERIPLFGEESPETKGRLFGDELYIVRGKRQHEPDLMCITQYYTQMTRLVRVFMIQQGALRSVFWASGISGYDGDAIKRLGHDKYKTETFSNGIENYGWTAHIWHLDWTSRNLKLIKEYRIRLRFDE